MSMNKIKKVLGCFVLGAAATVIGVTGGLINQQQTQIYNAAVTEEEITNSLPAFVDHNTGLEKGYFFSESDKMEFHYNYTTTTVTAEGQSQYYFKYLPDENDENHYYYFDIASVAVYINDTRLDISTEDLIIRSTASVQINQQGDAQTSSNSILPEILYFDVVYGDTLKVKEAEFSKENVGEIITPAILTINQTGVLKIEVQYDLYDTTLVKGSGSGNDTEISNILTSQSFSYSCFYLNAGDYFESTASKDAPKISYPSFTRTPSDSSMFRYNYFYNYSTDELPYISYDPNKIRLTITKYYNNNTKSQTLQYNPETKTITKPDFVYETMVMEDGSVRVYFNDVGQYNFNFEMIYTVQNADNYKVYTVPYKLLGQKAYLFGAQFSYTDYNTNQYQEFKLIENQTDGETITAYNKITQSADVSYLYNEYDSSETDGQTFQDWLLETEKIPVSTDQTPLRFTTNLNQLPSSSDTSTLQVWTLNNDTWQKSTSINDITSTINSPGTYFIELTYNFSSYTNNAGAIDSSKSFNQYFYFTIDKTAPSFTMEARGEYNNETSDYNWTQLLSKEYTNTEQVKVSYDGFNNFFHSNVRFEYERYDFINKTTSSGTITFDENGEFIFTEQGTYTIKVYYGKQGTAVDPSTSSFTIDRQEIQDLAAYTVYTSGTNNDYRISNVLEQYATNENFVFSWQNVKASGAKTYGKYKYYALNYTDYYSSVTESNLSDLLGALLRNGILATDATLDMSGTSNSWIDCSNASMLIANNNIIPSSYVKTNAGLYIFQIYDEAGNSQIQIILLDNTQPYFVLYTSDGFSIISANHTVTNDATLYWGDYKAIQVSDYNNGFSDSVYTNKDGKVDDEIKTALQEFVSSIRTYSSSSSSSGSIGYGKDGAYYLCEINDQFAFKHKDTDNYILTSGNSTDVKFSYTVHYTEANGIITYYYSTTTGTNFINVSTGETLTATVSPGTGEYQINGQTLHDANIYLYSANGETTYYYGTPGSLNLTSTAGQTVTATQGEDNVLYINGVALQNVEFVDMEGTYIFLIRDASNTEGANESELQRYMQYASNYQYLRVTGDQSLTQIQYYESGDMQNAVTLSDASYANISVVNQDEGLMSRSSYYNPTSLETILYLSFVPTIEHDDNTTTQVSQVSLSYYSYQTAVKTYLTSDGQIRYVYYRTLSATPEFTTIMYDFNTDGANTSTVEKQINVSSNMTTAGKYVVTRTYMTGENYTIDVFDYYQRNIASTVDRYGVLTSPEPISYTAETRIYNISGQNITSTLHGNILQLTTEGNFPTYDLRYSPSEGDEQISAEDVTIRQFTNGTQTIIVYEFEKIASYDFYENGEKIGDDKYQTSTTSDTSLESIVGGDIMINMYDGMSPNSGVISVAFPYYTGDSMLPSGDSFYTESNTSWKDSDQVNTTLTTNKLPISLYIPQYKYTIYNQESLNDDSSISFTNIANDYLIRFNENDEFSTISYYQLVAHISFTSSDGTISQSYTSTAGADGFLTFLDESGSPVSQFTQPGTYYVTITQGYNSDSNSTNNFRKNYKFAFEIEDTNPEFTITQSGAPLSSLNENEDVPNYYTNSKTITYTWEDLNNRYIANIDKSYIQVNYANSQFSSTSNVIIVSNDGKISLQNQNEKLLNALSYSSNTDSRGVTTNYLTVNLETLGIYQNNSTITLTMQFEGHNDAYYSRTTKKVTIDKQASYETVNGLIDKLQNISTQTLPLNNSTLRTYLDVEYKTVASAEEAAYNITVNSTTGQLRNYSYLVNDTFFETLSGMAAENNNPANAINYKGGTIRAFYREIENPYSSTYEESYSDFAPSAYNDMADGIFLTPNTYYQIVEEDLAGNLTFYIVYYYSVDNGNGVSENGDIVYQGISFTDHETEKTASDAQIATGKLNLYSSSNFTLNNLNFQGDKWLIVTVNGEYYMFSPWLDNGYVYKLSSSAVTTVSTESMFANLTSSATPITINISDRFAGNFANVKLTILDGVQLNTSMSNSQASEYLNVSYSNSVFPVSIEISNNGSIIYEQTNDPNLLENLTNPSFDYKTGWISEGNITATLQELYSRFNFAFVSLPSNGNKIRYAITDNFGNTTILVHIFGQTTLQEITSEGNRYEVQINDETTDGELVTYNISPVSLNYNFNNQLHYLKVKKWDGVSWIDAVQGVDYNYSQSGTTVTYMFSNLTGTDLANLKFKLEVYEVSEDENIANGDPSLFVKDVYFQIYQMLPHLLGADEDASNFVSSLRFTDNYGQNVTNEILTDDTSYRVNIGGVTYNVTKSGETFASRLTLTYSNSSNFDFPFTVQVYKEDGSLGSNFVDISSGTNLSESGVYYFLVKYVEGLTNEYNLYRIEILDSSTEFYRVTNNGKTVEKASTYYKDDAGIEYSEYYIVNVNYNTSASLVEIVPNDYQNITVSQIGEPINEGNNVITVGYRVTNYVENVPPAGGVSPFDRMVFITYIPPTSSPVTEAYFTYNSTEQTDILSQSSIMSAISIENIDSGVLKLSYSRSYGIAGNLINISILKDGVPYYPEVKYETTSSNRQLSYVELDRSGTYSISFTDTAGNKQIFASGTSGSSKTLTLIFLKDVSFSMTFTDANGVTQTTDPIQKGVFNNQVTLNLINANTYYTAQSIGSGANMITATKNGETYDGYTYNAETSSFTFNEPGYYSIYFSATASNGIELRHEIYNFTIVNPNESRYSFEFSTYDGYYIKSIVKDNLGDITKNADGTVPDALKQMFQTVVVDGQEYLKNVVTSFQDITTGEGYYTITIATNNNLNRDDYTTPTEFSFSYWINTSSVPINISVTEGESTSSNITVTFNAERVFSAVGECMIYVGNNSYHVSADTIAELGTVTSTISTSGTYYITVRSMSGNLLYSYKVIKTEPLNAWAIAAIVIGAVVAIVVVIIIIKTRKRIKVK